MFGDGCNKKRDMLPPHTPTIRPLFIDEVQTSNYAFATAICNTGFYIADQTTNISRRLYVIMEVKMWMKKSQPEERE